MASPQFLPLQERVPLKNTTQRLLDLLILALLLTLLSYRLATLRGHGPVWLIALLCESWFTFIWALTMNAKWNPVVYKTYPDSLSKRFDDLPAVDMFVTTADPELEPPIVTVNTVLSLLAVEYPAHKLACYVSDDGCSPITYYSLVEASKFAKLWVPFCKKYNVRARAPFVYLSSKPEPSRPLPLEFMEDWRYMKNEYEKLCRRIEDASKESVPYDRLDDELADFSRINKGNHQSIIKVLWENKERRDDGFPHLIYVAREKRPKHPHHYKAGAMNVLYRVSGVMTNAPFTLNVDCDMFVNNAEVVLHGMCLLLGFENEVSCGFVQTPHCFYGVLKDDPFGNEFVVLQKKVGLGIGGIQGPSYGGTGCFHRRKIIYGSPTQAGRANEHDKLSSKELWRLFGNSKELQESAARVTSEVSKEAPCDLASRIEAAEQVAACAYEKNTSWGKEVGLVYGSVTEDILTGVRIHSSGWRSAYLTLDPPAFLGKAPASGPASLTQFKRWTTGHFEVLFGQNSPVLATLTKQLSFRQCLAYLLTNVWALRSLVELCYALLPPYSLLTDASFLPKASEPAFVVPLALFVGYNLYTLMEFLQCGLSIRAWWNNQKMQRIFSLTSWLFAFFTVLLKTLGLSETIFEVTRKDQDASDDGVDEDPGRFTFDSSPIFVPATAVVLVNLISLAIGLLRLLQLLDGGPGSGLGDFACTVWVVLTLWPFVRGLVLVGRGSYGIPWAVLWKAALAVSVFLCTSVCGGVRPELLVCELC